MPPRKKEDKDTVDVEEKAVDATPAPEPKTETQHILSDRQRMVRSLVSHADQEPRRIESIEDLEIVDRMAVPEEIVKAYPERRFKWLSVDNLQSELDLARGFWVTCNRANSTRIPAKYWDDPTGGILFAGQNILAYTHRSNVEFLEKKTIHDFDMSERALKEKMNRTYHNASGKAIVTVEETDQFTSGGYGPDGPGTKPFVLNDNPELKEQYDFGDPS